METIVNVLQVAKFFPPVVGGIESVVHALTEGLVRRSIDCDVVCCNVDRVTVSERAPAGYRICRAARWGTVLSTSVAPSLPRLLRTMSRGRDLVHVHMPDPMAALAIWAARIRTPIVVHWHSDVVRQKRAMTIYEPLQEWLLDRAEAIVATSPPYAQSSAALQPWKHKVSIIPIGIADDRRDGADEAAQRIRARHSNRRIVFALGRMAYYKGFDVLIAAAARLPPDCRVLVGGAGELLDAHRQTVATLGLGDKVQFLGHLQDAELGGYFRACDVFCLPSTLRAEAFGVAMLEAMSLERPVVSCEIDGSGVPWVNLSGETGFNVPPGDSVSLAAAIRRLFDDDALRRRLGVGARARYRSHFDAETMIERTLALYERVLTRDGGNL